MRAGAKFRKILFRGETSLYWRTITVGFMSLGPLYWKWRAILSGGSCRNGVKMVPRLLLLKLMWTELGSSNFQAVFFVNSLNTWPNCTDNESSKKVPGTIGNLSSIEKIQAKKSIYLSSEACGFSAGGGADFFFAGKFFPMHDESNERKNSAAPCPAATEIDLE